MGRNDTDTKIVREPGRSARVARRLALVLAALIGTAVTAAAAAYPTRPVTIVVPYGPGSLADLVMEIIQPALEQDLGQRIILDHRPGAGGNIGADVVRTSAPDGYHLLQAATNNLVINQYLYAGKMSFDPLTSFVPVSLIADVPLIIDVNPALPVTTMKAFVAYAQAHPGKLNFGSPSAGTIPHLATEILERKLNFKAVHIAYKGGGAATAALLADEIQFMFIGYATLADQIRAGKVRAIAVASHTRLAALPNLPTFAESGYPHLDIPGNWWGLVAPKGTDPAIVNRLAAAIRKAVTAPAARQRYIALGFTPVGSTPASFAARLPGEAESWKTVIGQLGLTAQ
jgi:tripartite-type tricarboxylate transporter receptor subunit TctC